MTDSDPKLSAGPPTQKRQKLSHLSLEEKAVRRKMKNRVTAQLARDRRKAKMVVLEQQVLELELENQKLHVANSLLREKANNLLAENKVLRKKLCLDNSKDKMLSNGNEVGFGGIPGPSALPATQGPPSVKQEALIKQIHTDHMYAKPAEQEKMDKAAFPISEVAVDCGTGCLEDGPEEAFIACFNELSQVDDASFSGALSSVGQEACLLDAYCDSEYEWSRSTFSHASSPLCAWDDVLTNELFTQLVSV